MTSGHHGMDDSAVTSSNPGLRSAESHPRRGKNLAHLPQYPSLLALETADWLAFIACQMNITQNVNW